jgi:3'-phosphoadenosine 5'-phosphosulfate sulfotransferase (PAPS reductase)/FAD synthetase
MDAPPADLAVARTAASYACRSQQPMTRLDQPALWREPPAQVQLAAYRWCVVSSSGGKDSLVMLQEIVRRARAEDVLDRVVVAHADMGDMDWPGTCELAERQARHYGVRFEVVRRQQGNLLDHVLQRGMWPSATARYCTSEHKRGPIERLMTRLVAEARATAADPTAPVRILSCLGMRRQESQARAKQPTLKLDPRASNGKRQVTRWLPINDLLVSEVWEQLAPAQAAGLVHPAYEHGQSRASCVFCIFSSRQELIAAASANPDLAQRYELTERRTGHRFRVDLSMAEVIAAAGVPALPEP